MRQIGCITNSGQAERFADHLRAEGIACTVDSSPNGLRVWVHDDDHVGKAKEEMTQFLAEPDHVRYRDAERRSMKRMREDLARQRATRKHTVNLTEKWSRPANQDCPLTFGLIGISLVVAFFRGLNPDMGDPRFEQMLFSTDGSLQQILHGEVWRIFAPIFLHAGSMHLVFNLLATHQFGMQIESRRGSLKLFGMVLLIAAASNFAQFWFQGPWFGGMSGVVYGMFGYAWVKGRLEPDSGFYVPSQTVTMMLAWHVLCMVGVVSNIANWAHGVGLVIGVTMALSGSLLKPFLRGK